MVDPKFWSDDKIIELKPLSRLCFIGLWNFCDDNGVHKNNSKVIKAEIFPADDINISKIDEIVRELVECGLLEISDDDILLRCKNWNVYQKINRPQPSNMQFTERSLNNHEPVTANRIEKNIIEDNIKETKGQTNKSDDDSGFDQFYNLYPRKVQKERAKKSWKKLNKTDKVNAMDGLNAYIKYWNNKKVEKEFVPHPATWLNGRSWEDEINTGEIPKRVPTEKELKRLEAYKQMEQRYDSEKKREQESGAQSLASIIKKNRSKYYG